MFKRVCVFFILIIGVLFFPLQDIYASSQTGTIANSILSPDEQKKVNQKDNTAIQAESHQVLETATQNMDADRKKSDDNVASSLNKLEKKESVQPELVSETNNEVWKIYINLASCSLALYHNQEKVRLYPIGVGKKESPTPIGYFSIIEKEENPVWINPGNMEEKITSGEKNPLGYRWIRFYGNYGIHGTNKPDSIGHYLSEGCVRMKEADVEELYDLVPLGTPVAITYNRVVVEKNDDNMVVYYIYPDGYERQTLTTADVYHWLSGYGIDCFESAQAIADKIKASDGQPTYIARIYNIKLNGHILSDKAVVRDDIVYIPVQIIASTLHLNVTWNPEQSELATIYGRVPGYLKQKVLYCNLRDVKTLFNISGYMADGQCFVLNSLPIAGNKN